MHPYYREQVPLEFWQVIKAVPGALADALQVPEVLIPLTVLGKGSVWHALGVMLGIRLSSLLAIAATTPFAADLASAKQALFADFWV